MKVVVVIARVFLGLMFVFFGSNGFFKFLPAPPLTGLPCMEVSRLLRAAGAPECWKRLSV